MSSDKLISISLNIMGKKYPLKVNEDEAKVAKSIEKEINEKINDFKINYKNVDTVDSLIMVLLTYAFRLHNDASNDTKLVAQKIQAIEELVKQNLA